MYLSHPVRRMRDDPLADTEVGLVVELDDGTFEDLRGAVESAGGTVEADLGFDCWHVRIPESSVAALCELDGLARIETADTVRTVPDDTGE